VSFHVNPATPQKLRNASNRQLAKDLQRPRTART
jgi:hypothetical protein